MATSTSNYAPLLVAAGVGALLGALILRPKAERSPGSQPTADDLIKKYNLQPHPEGGYFVETFRAASTVSATQGTRSALTSIYFLVMPGSISRMHRLAHSDEVWSFYLGGPMTVVEISKDGVLKKTTLGADVNYGELVQHVVPAGSWFGSYPNEGSAYSFVGCMVGPGFDFADFELGSRSALLAQYPQHEGEIVKLTEGLP
mmetsp:Transcript_18435/g.48639  ORF Transcript_18435/g.48639 Transcript_18435/m.48639 type:complete len:201 (-) Transcript_18435:287-889(-)